MKVTEIYLPTGQEKVYGTGIELIARPNSAYNPSKEAKKLVGFLGSLPPAMIRDVLKDPRFRRDVKKVANELERKSLDR